MERKKHKNPISGQYFQEKDFVLGRTIKVGGWSFQLVTADEYTEKFMEDNADLYPEADFATIINKIKKGGDSYNSLQEYVIALIKRLDRNGDGVISFEEFTAGLRGMNIFVTDHEEHALMRKFDKNRDGKISMEEFYNTLAESY